MFCIINVIKFNQLLSCVMVFMIGLIGVCYDFGLFLDMDIFGFGICVGYCF